MFDLKVTPQDMQVILKGLGALPLNESLQTFMNLQKQAAEQQAKEQAAKGPTPPAPPAPPAPPSTPNGADGEGEPKTVN
jgi:hypothetical protein